MMKNNLISSASEHLDDTQIPKTFWITAIFFRFFYIFMEALANDLRASKSPSFQPWHLKVHQETFLCTYNPPWWQQLIHSMTASLPSTAPTPYQPTRFGWDDRMWSLELQCLQIPALRLVTWRSQAGGGAWVNWLFWAHFIFFGGFEKYVKIMNADVIYRASTSLHAMLNCMSLSSLSLQDIPR